MRTLSEEERRSRATAEAEAAVADHATAALDAELERVQQQAAEATTHLDVERVSARPASQPASQPAAHHTALKHVGDDVSRDAWSPQLSCVLLPPAAGRRGPTPR